MTKITLKGVGEAQEFLSRVERQLSPEGAAAVMELVVGMLHRGASSRTPVDTGRLKNSETMGVETNSRGVLGLVYTNVAYAPPVEKWARMFAQTIEKDGPKAMGLFDEELGDVLGS